MPVKPTMSQKRMVTFSCASAATASPFLSRRATCCGNTCRRNPRQSTPSPPLPPPRSPRHRRITFSMLITAMSILSVCSSPNFQYAYSPGCLAIVDRRFRHLIEQVVGPRRLHLRHDPPVPLPQLRLHPRHELRQLSRLGCWSTGRSGSSDSDRPGRQCHATRSLQRRFESKRMSSHLIGKCMHSIISFLFWIASITVMLRTNACSVHADCDIKTQDAGVTSSRLNGFLT